MAQNAARAADLPGFAWSLGRVLLVEADEQLDQLAAHGPGWHRTTRDGSAPGRAVVVGDEEADRLGWAVPPSEVACCGLPAAARGLVPGDAGECLPQRPAAAAGPGRLVQRQAAAECRSAVAGEELPFHDQVVGRVADGQPAEVDDRVQCPVRDKYVRCGEVPVHP